MVKWGGAIVTAIVFAAWLFSGWRYFLYFESYRAVGVGLGAVLLRDNTLPGIPPSHGSAWGRVEQAPHWYWIPSRFNGLGIAGINIPLWPVPVFALALTIKVWRMDAERRRTGTTSCPACNYDRTGLAPSAVCPECGTPASDKLPA
jgi:hypothetical protein